MHDGRLVVNSRTIFGSRAVAFSDDEGSSWTPLVEARDLPSPVFGCEGSTISVGNSSTLFYSGPNVFAGESTVSSLRQERKLRCGTQLGARKRVWLS